MNENDYVRKDVHEAEQDHLLDMIDALNKRIDDLKDSMNRIMTLGGIIITAVSVLLPVILHYFR